MSNTKPVEMLHEAYAAGQRVFGENYVQELVDKSGQLPEDTRFHFLGPLQSNKAKVGGLGPLPRGLEHVTTTAPGARGPPHRQGARPRCSLAGRVGGTVWVRVWRGVGAASWARAVH